MIQPYRSILFLIGIFGSMLINAQHFTVADFQKGVALKFSIIDEKRIEKAVSIINDASEKESAALAYIESIAEDEKLNATSPEYKKAVKMLLTTSETYREGFMLFYTIYQEKAIGFKETQQKLNHYAAGVNKARYYESKSRKAYERAMSIRDLLIQLEKYDLIQYKMTEAFELEKTAIRDRGRALQIYQDFPVEYNYGWEDDVTPEQVNAAFGDPTINRPPDDLFVQRTVVDTSSAEKSKPAMEPIVFYVQIAAHTEPMPMEYIREHIYAGNYEIREVYEGNWYKYSIGTFDNFNDAKALLTSSRVQKAFVVAYQNGQKLTIHDALNQIRQNQ
ncbi:MAG: hypothetical protein IPM71_00890 [Bacteroidota bacterium]|nr:MAG: hypothetical protein IPM71_00890 [Bacteroidota bacterium]